MTALSRAFESARRSIKSSRASFFILTARDALLGLASLLFQGQKTLTVSAINGTVGVLHSFAGGNQRICAKLLHSVLPPTPM